MGLFRLLAFDVESGGQNPFEHYLLSVGLCAATYDPATHTLNILHKHTINIEHPHHSIEEDAVKGYSSDTLQFWREHKSAWEKTRCNCLAPERAAAQVDAFIRQHQSEAMTCKQEFKWITDNAWYDNFWLSTLLCKYGYNPLRIHNFTGFMRSTHVIDTSQHYNALLHGGMPLIDDFQSSVPHDHTSANDAHAILEWYVHVDKKAMSHKQV